MEKGYPIAVGFVKKVHNRGFTPYQKESVLNPKRVGKKNKLPGEEWVDKKKRSATAPPDSHALSRESERERESARR